MENKYNIKLIVNKVYPEPKYKEYIIIDINQIKYTEQIKDINDFAISKDLYECFYELKYQMKVAVVKLYLQNNNINNNKLLPLIESGIEEDINVVYELLKINNNESRS